MKLCSICGAQAQDTDTFCSACGSQLEPTVLNAPEAPENPISAVAQTEAAAEPKTDDLEENSASDADKMNMPEAPHPLNQSCAHAQADVTPDGTQQATAEPKTDDLEENSASDAEKMNMPKVPHPLYQSRAHAQADGTQQTPPGSQNGAYVPPTYRAPHNDDPVTMGEWMLDLIVLNIPLLGFIMTFVWGFGTSAKPSLRNFARAMLVFKVILFILTVLLIVLFVTALLAEPQIYYQYSGY
ncbi:MAG: zinc-ribbon domain-containing protein [Ruthenibacterium sp.]